jgi:hypothetical protein
MLRLIENKPRRQDDDPWRRRLSRKGRSHRYVETSGLSVRSLLLLAIGLFGCAALLYPFVDDSSRLPTVHRYSSSTTKPGFKNVPSLGGDVDCAGGRGDGPFYVTGPIRMTGSDPHGLDSDGDGTGCE